MICYFKDNAYLQSKLNMKTQRLANNYVLAIFFENHQVWCLHFKDDKLLFQLFLFVDHEWHLISCY